jgi:hypothetical protein
LSTILLKGGRIIDIRIQQLDSNSLKFNDGKTITVYEWEQAEVNINTPVETEKKPARNRRVFQEILGIKIEGSTITLDVVNGTVVLKGVKIVKIERSEAL